MSQTHKIHKNKRETGKNLYKVADTTSELRETSVSSGKNYDWHKKS